MTWMKWLALVPFAAILGGAAVFNAVQPLILGMPLLLAWLVFCVILTSAVMGLIYVGDPQRRQEGRR